jgi:hypothetical protein
MADKMLRSSAAHVDVAVTNNPLTSGTFQMAEKAGGLLHCVSGSGTLAFISYPDINSSTGFALKDRLGATVQLTIAAGECYPLPEELFAAKKVQPVLNSGTATIRLLFKS